MARRCAAGVGSVRCGCAGRGRARQARSGRHGMDRLRQAGRGPARHGRLGLARLGATRRGRRGKARMGGSGRDWAGQGADRQGRLGGARLGRAWLGPARCGRRGRERRDVVRRRTARNGRLGQARFRRARLGSAGMAGVGLVWRGEGRQGMAGMERYMSDRTDTIAAELLALKSGDGVINPKAAVQWARENPKSKLYDSLEWDDDVAAERYRVWQVRALISVHVVDADGGRRFVSLTIDRKHDGSNGYRSLEDVVARPDLREVMLADALAELERIQTRYKRLTELEPVWAKAEAVRSRRRVKAVAA